jgi:hypothetical protein
MKLKPNDSAKSTAADGARPYASSVGYVQSREDAGTSQSTTFTEVSTRNTASVPAPFSDIVVHFTRVGDTTRQDIIRMGDISDLSTHLPSWAKLVDIIEAGGKFGLGFVQRSECIVAEGQINTHNERQFLACLQYLRNNNRLNVEAAVCSAETS